MLSSKLKTIAFKKLHVFRGPFQNTVLRGASAASTTQVRASAMLLLDLLIIRN
jgi:hypothetical protein